MCDVYSKPSGKRPECLFNFNDLKGAFISEWQISFFYIYKNQKLEGGDEKEKIL